MSLIDPLPLDEKPIDDVLEMSIPMVTPTAVFAAVPEPGFTTHDDPRAGRIQIAYRPQGNEHAPGTRVRVEGQHSPDLADPTGTVIGHNRAIAGQTERRHRLAMDHGGEWTCDFIDLTPL